MNWFGTTAMGSAGVILLAHGLAGPAAADSLFIRDRNISVLDRERPEFAAEGVRAGQFIVKPRLDISAGYTSNAFGISEVPVARGIDAFEDESDTFLSARPSVRADSLWSRHSVSAGGYFDTFLLREFDSEAVSSYGVFTEGQIDITRETALFGAVSFDHLFESRRANTSAILTADPVAYDVSKAQVGARHSVGRVRLRGVVETEKYNFENADLIPILGIQDDQVADQNFRDRTGYNLLGKVAYAIGRDVSVFFQSAYNFQKYEDEIGQGAALFDRDSEGWNVQLGADFDLTNLIRGSVAVGQFEQQYDDVRFNDAEGMSLDATLEWFPRESTTVTLTGRRGIDESAIVNAGGVVLTETALRVDQEIRHNVVGYVLTGLGELEYPDLVSLRDLDDGSLTGDFAQQDIERFRVGAGARMFHSRHLETSIDYLYETQDVQVDVFEGGRDTDYDVHQLLLTVTLKR